MGTWFESDRVQRKIHFIFQDEISSTFVRYYLVKKKSMIFPPSMPYFVLLLFLFFFFFCFSFFFSFEGCVGLFVGSIPTLVY